MSEIQDGIRKLEQNCALTHTGSPYHSPDGDRLAVEMEYGKMLMEAVSRNMPSEIVEIGTANGYSANWFSLGIIQAGKGRITTFDCIDRKPSFMYPDKINFISGKEFLQCLEDLPKKIDLVFHDAQHRYELITADLDAVMPLMSKDSQIWVHDVRGSELPKMMKDYFESRGFQFTHYPTGNGMGKAVRGKIV